MELFDPDAGQVQSYWWNHHVLIAQPMIWMAWYVFFLIAVNVCSISHPQVLRYLHRVPAASRLEHHEHPIRSSARVADLYSHSGPFLHTCPGRWIYRACPRWSHPMLTTLNDLDRSPNNVLFCCADRSTSYTLSLVWLSLYQ